MLVKNGWHPDLAYSMDDVRRTAYAIILGQMEGGKFNWTSMDWEKD